MVVRRGSGREAVGGSGGVERSCCSAPDRRRKDMSISGTELSEFGEFGEIGEFEGGEFEGGGVEGGEFEGGEFEGGEFEGGEFEGGEFEGGEFEGGAELEQFLGGILGSLFELESPLSESQEIELASELLEINNEQELEQFLGNI